jgi:hypothetical protein
MSKNPAVKQRYREARTRMITEFCKKYKFQLVSKNQDFQFRIEDVLDVYPTNGRWCWLPTKEWGDFDGEDDLHDVLMSHLEDYKLAEDYDPETKKEQLNALDQSALLRPVEDAAKDLGVEMPRQRRVRQPQDDSKVTDYFCIRNCLLWLTSQRCLSNFRFRLR